jgi:hypothetical protein
MIAWIAAAALADPNSEPELAIAVTHAWGAPIWGVRASAGVLMGLDRCGRSGAGGCAGDLHAVGGPVVRLDWRGRTRFGVEADGMIGGGLVEMHGGGFFPLSVLLVGAGPRLDETGIGLSTWGQAQQALGFSVAEGQGHRDLGFKPVALTVEGTVVWGLDAWYPSVAAGLQGSFWVFDFDLMVADTETAPPPPEP